MKEILTLVDHTYEDLELWYPKIRLEEAGCRVTVAGPEAGATYLGKHGYPCKADIDYASIQTPRFDGLVIPGGFAPDRFRRERHVLRAVRELDEAGKLIAYICHAGWVPISAKIVKGRRATGTVAIKDDLENAGAIWEDAAVVADGNQISSRQPADLPLFLAVILNWLSKAPASA